MTATCAGPSLTITINYQIVRLVICTVVDSSHEVSPSVIVVIVIVIVIVN